MELRHLRYFIAVAETGSLTEAAEHRLHTSQPSLSRQIRDLEEQVGVALFTRTPRGVELTAAGTAFIEHARLALAQVDAACAAALRAGLPSKKAFAVGFLTGQEMNWLPEFMHILRDELPNIEVTVLSDYSPDLGHAVARGKLDLAFMRAEPDFDLAYKVVTEEPMVVLMPSDHRLTAKRSLEPSDLAGEPFIIASQKATVLRAVIDDHLQRCGVEVNITNGVDNLAMAMSLVASTRGLSLMPAYAKNLLPWSVVFRPLAGETPTIPLAMGYSPTNTSSVLKLVLSRANELITRVSAKQSRES
jgi:LysR family hca operon transcriptional activator